MGDDQDVDRRDLHSGRLRERAFIEGAPGEVVLLKGALWQSNEALGAVHRSPEVPPNAPPNAPLRTLITFDPLWQA